MNVRVDAIDLEDLIGHILHMAQTNKKGVVTNVNVHAIDLATKEPWFRDFINHSEVVFCDGFGVKWAARFLHHRTLHRLTPPDWFDQLAVRCSERGVSMYFLGTRQEVIEKAALVARQRCPLLNIAGVHHGFFDKGPLSKENQEVVELINDVHPDILVVGFGMPAQEKWIRDNWGQLQVKVALPVGAFFDYLAGEVIRAPRWMTDHGLEWLGRLVIEPGRLWKRYIVGNPLFVWRVLMEKLTSSGR